MKRLFWGLVLVCGCLEPLPLDTYRYSCAVDEDCREGEHCADGACSTASRDAGAGGGGNTAGGNTAGGSTAGGNTAGGNTAGGSTAGGNTAGGNTAGGNTAGGSTAGGNTAGGNTAGGSTAGGNTAGGNTAGGNTAGGNAAGGNAAGGNTAGGNAAGGNAAGGNAAGGSAAGGSADAGAQGVLPVGHCRADGWCWLFPLPVGEITGVYVASPTTTYAASGRDLFRVSSDGGLTFDQLLMTGASSFEQTSTGLWVAGAGGISRAGSGVLSSSISGLTLMASSSGALWALNSGMILRFDGFQFQSVMPPATGCMKSYAAVGPNLLRHCKYGLFNSTLDEITPAGTVTTTRAVDGGDVFSIVGRSAQGVAALGFVGPTSFIGRLDLQGNFTPVVAAPSISLSELLEMGADENTVWPARRDMVFDLGAGTQTNVTVPTRSQFFSAGFGRVIAASPTSVSLAEGPLVRELLAPPSLSVQPSSRAAVWFFDGLSVISCPPALIVEPPTAFVPLSPIDLAEHPVTGERLAVTAQNVFRADGGVLPSLAGNQIPSRMIPFDRDQWLGIGETNGVSWTWSFDGVSWNQVALPNAPDAGRIVGLSASDAGVYAITSATLLSFDGTSWTSTTPPATGQLVGLCSLGPLLLIERRGAGTRSVQEYRPGVGFGSLRLVSTTHDLMCAGQRAFDVHRTNASVSEFMLDGGLEALQSPTRALGIVLDRQGREHLLGPSCSVLRRGP